MNIQLISLYLIIIFTLSKIIIERIIYSNKTINIKLYLKDSLILYISFNLLYYLLKNYFDITLFKKLHTQKTPIFTDTPSF